MLFGANTTSPDCMITSLDTALMISIPLRMYLPLAPKLVNKKNDSAQKDPRIEIRTAHN